MLGELTFHKKLGFLERGSDVDGIMRLIQFTQSYASQCGQVPYMHKYLLGNPLFPLLVPSMEKNNQILTFTLKAIDLRRTLDRNGELMGVEKGKVGKDQLSKWIAAKECDPTRFSTRDIIVHSTANVIAGSDTTAIALRSILYNLMRNPSTMDKLLHEIDQAQRDGKLSNPISYKESTTHLPYLHAVIKEAMRIHPSLGLLLERHVPQGGVHICNQHIPAGTIVGINPWVVHHDPVVFPEPETFLPERWIESGNEKLKEMEAAFFNFGAGSRTCIGKNFSLMEMSKIVPLLLRDYRFSLVDPGKELVVRNVQ